MAMGIPILMRNEAGQATYKKLDRKPVGAEATSYTEKALQDLIAGNPHLLPIRDFWPSTASVMSLGCEIPVDIGGKAGYIDNLLVTNEGRLVLVETKLWRNPEATREVIAQILQYGMAISGLTLSQLEGCLPVGSLAALQKQEGNDEKLPGIVEDFEAALERHLRRGELLYLIVSDGIRHSAERLTNWMSAGGSAPFKLGMVELQLFDAGDGQTIVIPKTLLKTVEISRHVVIVDIKATGSATAIAVVVDESSAPGEEASQLIRSIAPQEEPMTRERLIEEVRKECGTDEARFAEHLTSLLQSKGLQPRSLPTVLQYGFTTNDGADYYALITLGKRGVFSHLPNSLLNLIDGKSFTSHKTRLNKHGLFYRKHEAEDPTKRKQELLPSYASLLGNAEGIADEIQATHDEIVDELGAEK